MCSEYIFEIFNFFFEIAPTFYNNMNYTNENNQES